MSSQAVPASTSSSKKQRTGTSKKIFKIENDESLNPPPPLVHKTPPVPPPVAAQQKPKASSFQETPPTTGANANYKEYTPNPDHLLEMRTIQGNTFKNLLDTLKAVLTEANIVFTAEGLKLTAIDSNQFAVVHLTMKAPNFEVYHCTEKLVLGIDIDLLYKTIKTNKLNDLMCFVVHKDDTHCLEVSFENFQKGSCIRDKLKLLDLPESNISEVMQYPPPPEIDSQLFQTICREMSTFHATKIKIKCIGDELIFANLDGSILREVVIKISPGESVNGEPVVTEPYNASGVFLLKFLKSFAKAANLSPRVRIYLKNDYPLICQYIIAGLGELKYLMVPLEE